MSSSPPIDAETLLSLPITEAIAESGKRECWDYGEVFSSRTEEAERAGEARTATAWRLLKQLAQVHLQSSDLSKPFIPLLVGPHGRTFLPTDLDNTTAAAVHALAKQTADPELRSRLMDIIWDARRDHLAAREAVQSYLQSAARLMDPEQWLPYVERCERALRLATQIRDSDLQQMVLAEIEDRVLELDRTDRLYMTNRLMELLIEFDRGDPEKMSAITEKAASLAEGEKEFDKARSHLENLVRWSRMAKNEEAERGAKIRIAASYEHQAELRRDDGESLAAADWMVKAHDAYRRITGMGEKTAEVYRQLRKFQRRAAGEMKRISTEPIDMSQGIKWARERVSGLTLHKALLALAAVSRPTSFDQVAQHSRELMEQFPLQSLIGGVVLDNDGRMIAHRSPVSPGDTGQQDQALWEQVVQGALLNEQLAVQVSIIPALNQIMFEHNPTLRDLRDLVIHNPFVPQGREELFAKGFLAGLRGDFPEALSILVPQMENSLRHLLEESGVDISKLTEKRGEEVQDVIALGSVLSEERLEEILNPDVVKELKVLFSDRQGPKLRDYIAHGLMCHDEFYSPLAIYAWWFIFYLCICPVQKRFRDEPESSE